MAQAFANEGYEGEDGAYQHFLDYGMSEDVSPSALFDVDAYYINKLDALKNDPKTAEEWADKTVDDVKDAFTANGLSAWEHYQQFGTAEGINPSADFDTVKYLEAKAAAMNALGGDKVWTAADVADAFAENGWSALEHYELFGNSGAEGEVAPSYNPAPVVTLTFADALAAETLPAEYFLADGAASFEGVAVADLEAAQAKAQSIFDGALNKADLEYSVAYTLSDTLANIMAADAAVLEGHAYTLTDGVVDLGDGSVEAIVAAQAAAQALIDGSANETKPELAATYTLSDSLANIMDPANADMVTGAGSYALTDVKADLGEVTVDGLAAAQLAATTAAQAVIAGATNASELGGLSYTFVLNDTVAHIQDLGGTLPEGATGYILTDTLTNLKGASDNLFHGAAQVFVSGDVATIDDADVADAVFIGSLDGIIYNDTFVNLQDALHLNEANVSYTLTDTVAGARFIAAHVAVADVDAELAAARAFVAGATNGAEYADTDYGYTILDTIANIKAASNDVLAKAEESNGITVSDTLAAFDASNDILTNTAYGIDQAIASVASDTTISTDTLTAINSATVTLNALADSAVTVDASSDTTSVTVDLSSPSFTLGGSGELTFNVTGGSGADTIKAHANGGTLIGGDGADTFTLGAGADIVDLTEDTPAVDTVKLAVNGAGITDTITGFTAGATAGDALDAHTNFGIDGLLHGAGATASNTVLTALTAGAASIGTNIADKLFLFEGTVEDLGTLIKSTATDGTLGLAGSATAFVLIGNVADGEQVFDMYQITGNGGDNETFTQIGTIGVSDGDALHTDNFVTA
ncbi:hypothetical protein [Bilophila wadsworthia]|uniref:hypothetical protein n=1 Tax=Bilophila wadsworthia TaxID=35833 RepID=UPI00307C8BC5